MFDFVKWILLVHVVTTWYMIGLIWFVQVVHYPLLAAVGREQFTDYERRHVASTTWVVGPPMLLELFSAVFLLWVRPASIELWLVWVGLIALLLIWASTFFLQVPCHEKLSRSFDESAHRQLVRTNWLRTIAWSIRGLVVILMQNA
ncbi:hypothetical protein [Bremerella sp.]|uniref:hypothetical protein n=1 Tax=Bremerella sp. TaxID=2795602 RepID=UPI00391AE08E